MKRHINNPYKMNWKMYGLIGGISVLVMVVAVICNDKVDSLILDVVKNLAFGCVASTLVALLIEIGNIKEKNEKANSVYDAVYLDLKSQIMWYVETWARLCSVAYKDEDYRQEKHTWIEWYDMVKSKFLECEAERQEELIHFFNEQLLDSIEGIEKALKQIERQQYILNIHGIYDDNLKNIFADYSFEFYAAKISLGKECDIDDFWRSFDAIKEDLIKYIHNWVDIRYYNYYRFSPFKLHDDKEEIIHAMLESEKNTYAEQGCKIKNRRFWSHFFEVVSYIAYTVSVYYMSHFNSGEDFVPDDTYRIFAFCFVASTFGFFKGEKKEVFKEILKSGGILILCQIIDVFLFGKEIEFMTFLYIIVSQVVWQLVSLPLAYLYNSNYEMHGRYTNRLIIICMFVLFLALFVFDLSPIICVLIYSVFFFLVGYHYYKKNMAENRRRLQKIEEVKQNELKAARQKEQERKELEREIKSLKEENKKLRAKLNLIETKKRRKPKKSK